MKKLLSLILSIVLFYSCGVKEVKKYSIEQFYKNKNISGGSFSADETKLLVTSNETGIYNLFVYPIDGSAPQQVTNSTEESYFAVSFIPSDERILFMADKGGNENDHIYLLDTNKAVTDITPVEGAKFNFFGWSRDQKSFYYISNQRDPKYFDLYKRSLEDILNPDKSELLYTNTEGYTVASMSDDEKYIALSKSITTNNNELYLYNRESGELKHISAHEGDARYAAQFFDLKSENLYLLTNENSEYMYLSKYIIAAGTYEKVYETGWDVWYTYDSYNEKYRVIGVNEDAKTKVEMIDLATNQPVELPKFEGGDISSVLISKSEKLMRLTVATSSSPSNIYVYNIETKELKKLTETLNPEINQADLVEGKVVRYKSFDGTEIPAVYYQPINASESNNVPALVWVHGGPGGQSRLNYFALIQFLVNQDYAIIAVNNRGSSGYGKTFFSMDDKNHGEKDLKDCIAAKDFLKTTGVIDTTKIGIIGGSYGGYMVMAALTFAPEEFAVGVNLFGVTNWLRTLKSIPPYWEQMRQALYAELGNPFSEDSLRLYNISPLFHAKNVTKPLMVLQGKNDPRVLQVESDEIVAAVKENNVPVEYVIFEDEGHGFVKKDNEIEGYGKIKVFLDKYLKGLKEQQ